MSLNTREERAAILLSGLDAASAENVLRRLAPEQGSRLRTQMNRLKGSEQPTNLLGEVVQEFGSWLRVGPKAAAANAANRLRYDPPESLGDDGDGVTQLRRLPVERLAAACAGRIRARSRWCWKRWTATARPRCSSVSRPTCDARFPFGSAEGRGATPSSCSGSPAPSCEKAAAPPTAPDPPWRGPRALPTCCEGWTASSALTYSPHSKSAIPKPPRKSGLNCTDSRR